MPKSIPRLTPRMGVTVAEADPGANHGARTRESLGRHKTPTGRQPVFPLTNCENRATPSRYTPPPEGRRENSPALQRWVSPYSDKRKGVPIPPGALDPPPRRSAANPNTKKSGFSRRGIALADVIPPPAPVKSIRSACSNSCNLRPAPRGHGSFHPGFSSNSLSPWTHLAPRSTRVPEAYPGLLLRMKAGELVRKFVVASHGKPPVGRDRNPTGTVSRHPRFTKRGEVCMPSHPSLGCGHYVDGVRRSTIRRR